MIRACRFGKAGRVHVSCISHRVDSKSDRVRKAASGQAQKRYSKPSKFLKRWDLERRDGGGG